MKNQKAKGALLIGILAISIFPILVRLSLNSGLISAFYRMAIALLFLLPYVLLSRKFHLPKGKILWLSLLAGVVFASDVAVWNIAIQHSSATQATLLTNLSPVWVGIGSFVFLNIRPATNFWIGTVVALFGMIMLVGFHFFLDLSFDLAFGLAVLSGILYAVYILLSKSILEKIDVLSFMTLTLMASTVFLGLIALFTGEAFFGFSNKAWMVLFIQGIVCQLLAWLCISYATQRMRATRVSLSLLSQAVLAALLAYIYLDEEITLQMIIGGLIMLLGIRITFLTQNLFSFELFWKQKK